MSAIKAVTNPGGLGQTDSALRWPALPSFGASLVSHAVDLGAVAGPGGTVAHGAG